MDQRELLATNPRPLPDHQMDRLLMRCNLQGEAIRTRREQNESNRTCHDLIYDTTSEAKSKDKHTLTTKQRTHGEQSDLTSRSSSHSLTPIPLLFFVTSFFGSCLYASTWCRVAQSSCRHQSSHSSSATSWCKLTSITKGPCLRHSARFSRSPSRSSICYG